MEKEALKRIIDFLEEKEQQNPPFLWKYKNNIPFTEEDLNVKGDLNLFNTKIKSLPKGLKVKGYLNLINCEILTSLPKGLEVGGNLYLQYTNITSLPKGLKVSGALFLSHTPITLLPKGLKVGDNLYIKYTPLKKYTDDELRKMVKPGFIKGEIYR